jgi:hypothetical protein
MKGLGTLYARLESTVVSNPSYKMLKVSLPEDEFVRRFQLIALHLEGNNNCNETSQPCGLSN